MLDVHAPEHRISEARDFWVHLFTITVGLLIALGMENAAEAIHHHHQREVAEANIREELRRNQDSLQHGLPQLKKEYVNLIGILPVLDAFAQGKTPAAKQYDLSFADSTLDDGAWRTAASTGVLAYMPYDDVERFSDAYKEQAMLEDAQNKALEDYLQLSPMWSGASVTSVQANKKIDPDEAKSLLATVRVTVAHLNGIMAVGQGTLDAYKKALQ